MPNYISSRLDENDLDLISSQTLNEFDHSDLGDINIQNKTIEDNLIENIEFNYNNKNFFLEKTSTSDAFNFSIKYEVIVLFFILL